MVKRFCASKIVVIIARPFGGKTLIRGKGLLEALPRRDDGHDFAGFTADAVNKPIALKDHLVEGFVLRNGGTRVGKFPEAFDRFNEPVFERGRSLRRVLDVYKRQGLRSRHSECDDR